MEISSDINWRAVQKHPGDITNEKFLKSIDIWNDNPSTVNQRVHSSIVILKQKLALMPTNDLLWKILSMKEDLSLLDSQQISRLVRDMGFMLCSGASDSLIDIYVKKLIPKNKNHFSVSFELSVIDRNDGLALFTGFPVLEKIALGPKFPFRFSRKSGFILEVLGMQKEDDPSLFWLSGRLFPQMLKWAETPTVEKSYTNFDLCLPLKSHSLICPEDYAEVYQTLKTKYGRQLVEMWTECTDPAKYVYEDIAIASYILLLWKGKKHVSFVDLGCGNGLLVHILNSEGHKGVGIDVRSRKIWEMYPETTKLQIGSITPSDLSLFPDAEWLIGNHSDELTPWIPVIAARSSQACKFFLLPCCPYDFDGLKYRRKNALVSQYSDFLSYVKEIAEKCGFKVELDKMRIPSTKRICLVGQSRTYLPETWNDINCSINDVIREGCRRGSETQTRPISESCGENEWVADYKPREAVERVRNCTQLEKTLVSEIVSLTANHLLIKHRTIPHPLHSSQTWNAGGSAAISEIIPLIGAEKLKKLKNECGGLQTLLKNHHQIFLVEKGTVRLRIPMPFSKVKNRSKVSIQHKPCWFYQNHPDGCVLKDSECAFKH